jgi:hemoglobin-like flavoprotein
MQVDQGKLLQESMATFRASGTAMPQAFFDALKASHPEFQERFARVDLATLSEAFLGALDFIARNYEQRATLERTLRDLGARHIRYGVRPEHFGIFGACLLDTMSHFTGPAWTLSLDLAWRTAFERVAEIMLEGATGNYSTAAAC